MLAPTVCLLMKADNQNGNLKTPQFFHSFIILRFQVLKLQRTRKKTQTMKLRTKLISFVPALAACFNKEENQ